MITLRPPPVGRKIAPGEVIRGRRVRMFELDDKPSRQEGMSNDGNPARPTRLHHVALLTRDIDAARAFYVDLIGLVQHPTKANWLLIGERGGVHLLERPDLFPFPSTQLEHFALQVDSLEAVYHRLLDAGRQPFQLDFGWDPRYITDPDADLDWGLGTLFVLDNDGHAVEFVQARRGIFGAHIRTDMS
jgi:catechol 2,3-dioxygenase-like lactoylglutathione lyase family enzyme